MSADIKDYPIQSDCSITSSLYLYLQALATTQNRPSESASQKKCCTKALSQLLISNPLQPEDKFDLLQPVLSKIGKGWRWQALHYPFPSPPVAHRCLMLHALMASADMQSSVQNQSALPWHCQGTGNGLAVKIHNNRWENTTQSLETLLFHCQIDCDWLPSDVPAEDCAFATERSAFRLDVKRCDFCCAAPHSHLAGVSMPELLGPSQYRPICPCGSSRLKYRRGKKQKSKFSCSTAACSGGFLQGREGWRSLASRGHSTCQCGCLPPAFEPISSRPQDTKDERSSWGIAHFPCSWCVRWRLLPAQCTHLQAVTDLQPRPSVSLGSKRPWPSTTKTPVKTERLDSGQFRGEVKLHCSHWISNDLVGQSKTEHHYLVCTMQVPSTVQLT